MIEQLIKEQFDGHFDVPSFFEHPRNPPNHYVLIEKTGSSKRNQLKTATFAFQSYAPSLYEAASLNEKVKDFVDGFESLGAFSGVHLNSDYNYTDTSLKTYRYQAVFDFNYY